MIAFGSKGRVPGPFNKIDDALERISADHVGGREFEQSGVLAATILQGRAHPPPEQIALKICLPRNEIDEQSADTFGIALFGTDSLPGSDQERALIFIFLDRKSTRLNSSH